LKKKWKGKEGERGGKEGGTGTEGRRTGGGITTGEQRRKFSYLASGKKSGRKPKGNVSLQLIFIGVRLFLVFFHFVQLPLVFHSICGFIIYKSSIFTD